MMNKSRACSKQARARSFPQLNTFLIYSGYRDEVELKPHKSASENSVAAGG